MVTDPVVSTEWLAAHLGAPDLRILDASWHMPSSERDPHLEYQAGHIPGAVFFDIDAISDHASPLPHMLPNPIAFARQIGDLGVGSDTFCVVYDSVGLFSAPRVWWMLRAMGHDKVAVLDGGLPKWLSEGRPVEVSSMTPRSADFRSVYRPGLVQDLDGVRRALDDRSAQVLDARSAERFAGDAPEPRVGLPSGHMPGAKNLPWARVVTQKGVLKSSPELRELFREAEVDPTQPVICSCGSGVSAAVLALALARLGHRDIPIYDGSWTEWASRDDTPIATG